MSDIRDYIGYISKKYKNTKYLCEDGDENKILITEKQLREGIILNSVNDEEVNHV